MARWISVKTRLPPLDETVLIAYPSGYDGKPVYAWGARVDDSEGWLWGRGGGFGVRPDKGIGYNDIEADDDYPVTHWMPLPRPPTAPAPSCHGTHGER
jgi:hypothetical protein